MRVEAPFTRHRIRGKDGDRHHDFLWAGSAMVAVTLGAIADPFTPGHDHSLAAAIGAHASAAHLHFAIPNRADTTPAVSTGCGRLSGAILENVSVITSDHHHPTCVPGEPQEGCDLAERVGGPDQL